MEFKVFEALPEEAMALRQRVFVEEQGFCDEFDEVDGRARHLVGYEQGRAGAVCRFVEDERGVYLLGRLAVERELRGRGLGALALAAAEREISRLGGREVRLHAQEQAMGFYLGLGYEVCSEREYEQGCPHYWMRKLLPAGQL